MKLELLDAKHPTYDAETWERYWALYKGGKTLRQHVKHFLNQNEGEPAALYQRRLKEAAYRSYVGPIVDYYGAALFTSPPIARAKDDAGEIVEADDYYSDWKEDCDGAGCDFHDFLRARFRDMLVRETAWWIVELPEAEAPVENKLDWADKDLGEACLHAVESGQVYDWECDARGRLQWVTIHTFSKPRHSPRDKRNLLRQEWRVYDATNVEIFAIEYDPQERMLMPEDEIPSLGIKAHGFKRVPVVRMHAPDGLWLVDRVAEAQTEHFRLSAGLGWAIRRTCYAMPIFKTADIDRPPKMGTGYYLIVGAEDGLEWAAPPAQPFEVIATEVMTQKDEIYRVTNQMALGVENNAAAIGRSAQSKETDSSSTETCLRAYAAPVREAAELTYDLLSEGRGDAEIDWSIEGLDRFNLADATASVAVATQAQLLDIPSRTFKVEMARATADALLPGIDQGTKDTIHTELEEGVAAAEDLKDEMKQTKHAAETEALEEGALKPPPLKPAFGAKGNGKPARA
jgi:hypothetical protein